MNIDVNDVIFLKGARFRDDKARKYSPEVVIDMIRNESVSRQAAALFALLHQYANDAQAPRLKRYNQGIATDGSACFALELTEMVTFEKTSSGMYAVLA